MLLIFCVQLVQKLSDIVNIHLLFPATANRIQRNQIYSLLLLFPKLFKWRFLEGSLRWSSLLILSKFVFPIALQNVCVCVRLGSRKVAPFWGHFKSKVCSFDILWHLKWIHIEIELACTPKWFLGEFCLYLVLIILFWNLSDNATNDRIT